jgi:putative hydrolase of the HAD superfamily
MTPELVRDVDLLCLDAGNTIVFFDHARLASLCLREGFVTTADEVQRAEGEAKLALERGDEVLVAWSQAGSATARSWAAMVGTMLVCAGLPRERLAGVIEAIWRAHRAQNLWSLLPDGLAGALAVLRGHGVRVAVVSNSEGKLAEFFGALGLLDSVDCIVDSGVVGVEKPDPRIFRIALDHFGVPAERALHLGDNFVTDVGGARSAGLRVGLVDPFGHLAGRHPDVPRVPGVAEVAAAIVRARVEGVK